MLLRRLWSTRLLSSSSSSSGRRAAHQEVRRKSGVQKEVLALYRELLRAARHKDSKTVALVRDKFRKEATSIGRFEFQKIEHHIRKGNKYVKLLQSDSVKGLSA